MVEIEVQFAEGFTGQPILIEVAGKVSAEFEARTKLMTGLAHVEPMTLPQGTEVTVRMGGDSPSAVSFPVDPDKPFVVVSCVEKALEVAPTAQRPGYL